MKFFDYIFYRVCKAYSKTSSSSSEFSSACIVSMMQAFSIFIVIMLVEILKKNKSILNLGIVISTMIFFMVYNYIRYVYKENNSYKVFEEKWRYEVNPFKKGMMVFFYVIATTALFFGIAIYLGSKKW